LKIKQRVAEIEYNTKLVGIRDLIRQITDQVINTYYLKNVYETYARNLKTHQLVELYEKPEKEDKQYKKRKMLLKKFFISLIFVIPLVLLQWVMPIWEGTIFFFFFRIFTVFIVMEN